MKNILSILTVLALAAAAQAGCGKTATSEGTLKSFDAEKKDIVVSVKGKDTTIAITPETKGADGLKDLVGKAEIQEIETCGVRFMRQLVAFANAVQGGGRGELATFADGLAAAAADAQARKLAK